MKFHDKYIYIPYEFANPNKRWRLKTQKTLDDFPVMSDLRTKRVQLLEQTKTVSNLEKSQKENLSRPLHS